MTTHSASKLLNVSTRRVTALIHAGRLQARRDDREWQIDPAAIDAVRNRRPGRPSNADKSHMSIIRP